MVWYKKKETGKEGGKEKKHKHYDMKEGKRQKTRYRCDLHRSSHLGHRTTKYGF